MSQMQRASNVRAFRVPQHVLDRWYREGKASAQAQDVTSWCDVCGVVLPTRYHNAYVRRDCACRDLERETGQRQAIRLTQEQAHEAALMQQCARCFNWLSADMCQKLTDRTFTTFAASAQPDAYAAAWQFAEARSQTGNLLLFGSCGTGKTHLAAAICNALRERLIPCRFMTGQGLFDSIQLAMDEDMSYQPFLDEAARTPVLVIDDLDKIHVPQRTGGDFQIKTLFSILNKRYLQEFPTVITTNAEDITPYIGVPAFSRLKEGLVLIPMYGEDWRDGGQRNG